MARPNWLPQEIDANKTWDELEDEAYIIFERDFKLQPLYFCGKTVNINDDIDKSEKKQREKGFYHLIKKTIISRSKRSINDAKRAVRIGWVIPIINNSNDSEILKWDMYEDLECKTYLWLKKYNFIVILEDKNGNYFLKTAFFVDKGYEITLLKKYAKRI